MLTNADLTIFNQFPDRQSKKMVYVPHYIDAVWFHTDQKTDIVDGGLTSKDVHKIRIPYEKCGKWLPENEFKVQEPTSENWTVQNGDLFLVGKWTGGTVSGIAELKKQADGIVGEVLSHSKNFFGGSKHIRIGGGA